MNTRRSLFVHLFNPNKAVATPLALPARVNPKTCEK
jgi:hypothetical protein